MAFALLYNGLTSTETVSAVLSLNYEEAYEGLNPNGTRFNVYELESDEILELAIKNVGLEGELTAAQLREGLSVTPSRAQSVSSRYIATEYNISLSGSVLPDSITAESMMRVLMRTYKEQFLNQYGTDDSALDMDWSDVENWEYLEFADIMSVRVENLITYLDELKSESGMSQYRIEGENFRSLRQSVVNFRDIYLEEYTSFINENCIYANNIDYLNKMQYKRFLMEQELSEKTSEYEIRQEVLNRYDESMITFVMVPMYDDKNGLYMARTDIGIDDLSDESLTYWQSMRTRSLRLKEIDSAIENTSRANDSEELLAQANAMILDIEQRLDELVERIRTVSAAYEDFRSKNDIQYSIKTKGLMSGYNVKKVVVLGAAIVFLCVAYYAVCAHREKNDV
jgi:hypothetical protein